MNPALTQPPYNPEAPYSGNADNRILEQDTFGSVANFSSSNSQYLPRRGPGGSNNASLEHAFNVPTHSSLEYNQSFNTPDNTYPASAHSFFSPPCPLVVPQTATTPSHSSTFNLVETSRTSSSNGASTEQYSLPIPPFSDSPWNVPLMPELRNTRHALLHPDSSSTVTFLQPDGMTGHYQHQHSNRPMDHYSSTYGQQPRPFLPPNSQHGFFDRQGRGSIYNQLPMPVVASYSMNTHYSSMAPQPPVRPDGPPFEDTKVIQPLVTGSRQPLTPEISACIQKGFFQVEGKWTCYRRNYFTVCCAFSFKNTQPDGTVFLQRGAQVTPVQQYAISISAKTANHSNQEPEVRNLVQHTPKRDKATESVPGRHVVLPAPPQAFQSNGLLPSSSLYHAGHHLPTGMLGNFDAFGTSAHSSVPTQYTFERIQFQKATANNGKRRAQQQFFQVVVELSVNVGTPNGKDDWVVVATKQSHPMVVRGRSPGHYKDNLRRDGQTNMDPDRGNGTGGDGHLPNLPMPYQQTAVDWASQRPHNAYGGAYSRPAAGMDGSPQSMESSPTLTATPDGTQYRSPDLIMERTDLHHNGDARGSRSILNQDRGFEQVSNHQNYNRKRPYDDDESDSECEFYTEAISPKGGLSHRLFELPSSSNLSALCSS